MPPRTAPLRPRASDLHLGLWVVGLLTLTFGVAGLYGTAVDYDARPEDSTIPAVAVLLGGSLVLLAAAIGLAQLARRLTASRH